MVLRTPEDAAGVGVLRFEEAIHGAVVSAECRRVVIPVDRHRQGIGGELFAEDDTHRIPRPDLHVRGGRAMEGEHLKVKDNPFEEEILWTTATDDPHPFRTVAIATK
jgi:hypothetical protein